MPSTPSSEQLRLISDAARALEKADPCNGDRGRIVARLSRRTVFGPVRKHITHAADNIWEITVATAAPATPIFGTPK